MLYTMLWTVKPETSATQKDVAILRSLTFLSTALGSSCCTHGTNDLMKLWGLFN